MVILVGNKNNIFTTTFDATAKTVKISNNLNFPLDISSLKGVYDTTVSLPFSFLGVSFSWARVAGLPVYTWTFASVPAGSANGDTLQAQIEIPQNQSVYSALLQTNTATV